MKRKVFSLFDVVAKVYGPPMLFVHEGEALRSFEDIVKNSQTLVSKHPADFRLYRLGEFDDVSGETIVTGKQHREIGRAHV